MNAASETDAVAGIARVECEGDRRLDAARQGMDQRELFEGEILVPLVTSVGCFTRAIERQPRLGHQGRGRQQHQHRGSDKDGYLR